MICERNISWSPHATPKSQGYNLDRKDNSIGYTKDNCVVCCGDCNTIKGNRFTYDEMIILKPSLIQIQQKRKG